MLVEAGCIAAVPSVPARNQKPGLAWTGWWLLAVLPVHGRGRVLPLLPGTWITDLAGWWLKAVPSCFFLVFDCLKGLTHYSKPLKWISTLVATVHFRCVSALSQTPALDNLGFSSCILQNELFFLPCPELHEIALCREVLLLFHPTPEAPRSFTPALHWKVTREWWMQ